MFRPVDRPLSFRQRASNWIYKVSLNVKTRGGWLMRNSLWRWSLPNRSTVCVCVCVCVEGKETKGKRGKTLREQQFPRHSRKS